MAEYNYHCHTCGRKIFSADRPEVLRARAYCNRWCEANATNARQTENHFRNDLWFWLIQTGRSAIYVARLDDVAGSIVYKSIRSRKKEAGASS